MPLLNRQFKFVRFFVRLLVWIHSHPGWGVTLGDAARMDGQGHVAGSFHYIRLAVDLNLFVDGEMMTGDCPEWRAIGAYWKSLDPECTWGGDFKSRTGAGDFNHFSLGEKGRAA